MTTWAQNTTAATVEKEGETMYKQKSRQQSHEDETTIPRETDKQKTNGEI